MRIGRIFSLRKLSEGSDEVEKIPGLQNENLYAPETPLPEFWFQGISGQILLWFLKTVWSANQGSLGESNWLQI